MELIPDWKDVLKKAWSMWTFYALALVSLAEAMLPFVDMWFGPKTYALTVFAITVIGAGLRIVKQTGLPAFLKDESGRVRLPRSRAGKAGTGLAGMVAAAAIFVTPMVKHWEGQELEAYRDIVGVYTICSGETKGVVPGMTKTAVECDAMLSKRLIEFGENISRCLPPDIPMKTRAAFISASYNIGVGGFCGSSMARRAQAGNLMAACEALLMWDKGRINGVLQRIRGLTRRREAERALCLEGLRG